MEKPDIHHNQANKYREGYKTESGQIRSFVMSTLAYINISMLYIEPRGFGNLLKAVFGHTALSASVQLAIIIVIKLTRS